MLRRRKVRRSKLEKRLSKNGMRCQKMKNFRESSSGFSLKSSFHQMALVKGQLLIDLNSFHSLAQPWLKPQRNYKPLPFMVLLQPRNDGVGVRASASQSVDLGFISQVKSYQNTLKKWYSQLPHLALSR